MAVAKYLKSAEERNKKVFIEGRSSQRPGRVKEAERIKKKKNERERPENVGCNIYLNVRERKLYKDGLVIDEWGGVKRKLEKCNVIKWIGKYDIISLNEIKTELCVNLSGNAGYRKAKTQNSHRGGTVVFV